MRPRWRRLIAALICILWQDGILWTDSTHGLQLTVRTAGGAVLYSGALSGLGVLAGPTILSPGGTETLRYTFDFPATASNAFQGLVQDLALVFDAVEYP